MTGYKNVIEVYFSKTLRWEFVALAGFFKKLTQITF